MKRNLLLTIIAVFVSLGAFSQQGQVSMIGEFNVWNGDHNMTRDYENPNLWSTYITLVDNSDTPNDTVEVKFRLDADWAVNWGAADFPTGTATMGGANIPAPKGSYYITFEFNPSDSTATYNFQRTSGDISMIGEFNLWTGDHEMTRSATNPDMWTTGITLKDITETPDDTVEVKFRQNADWTYNWGGPDFPSGTAVNGGANIKAPEGSYFVTFEWLNDTTANYTFQRSSGVVSMIGEFNGWSADYPMHRLESDPNMWGTVLHLNADSDDDGNDTIEVKFRQNADWTINWGGTDFPAGTGTGGGPNILVPLNDEADPGISTDYLVLFTWVNDSTCQYTFQLTSGPISMIGAFNNWNGDVMMTRDPLNPQVWTLTRSWYEDSEVKFRENKDWSQAWGNSDWPSGVGNPDNGPNIPLVAGTYDVTFNALTFEYNFVPNNDVCGEIELVGDFNEWGANEDLPPTFMARDPMYPSEFTLTYNFTAATNLFFKMSDGQPIGNDNVWGGTFPCDAGVHDVTQLIQVPGGKYDITFNCTSGDFCFTRLGNSVIAPKVFDITVDGKLNETDWNIDENISRIIDGEANDDVNEVNFGVTYKNPDGTREGAYLFVGVEVVDAVPFVGDAGEVFIDGDKSGGVYDDHDLRASFGATGVQIIEGPEGLTPADILLGFQLTSNGYSAEIGIPLDKLGVTPEEDGQMGFDLFYYDDDGNGVDYTLAWNGGIENVSNTSSFGDLIFGSLSCGCISVYNSTIGDVILRNPTDMPTNYVGTYEFFDAQDVVFRKDGQSTVQWGAADFPGGTATLNGPMIPATADRYRVSFDCTTGVYNFSTEQTVPDEGLANADYADTPPVIDGDVSEYTTTYGSDELVVGTGPINNTVVWGARWDEFNLYIGAAVTDAVVEYTGNPWDNDAIEMYIDGNNDKDGTYDADFDTQLIMDANPEDTLWVKADGVPVTDFDAIWKDTDNGYNIELRLAWSNFDFAPGRGRVMGWSLSNNDSDNNTGRDYQSTWYGTGSNWSNTADLGDLQLAGGPYFFANSISENNVLYNADIVLFPNPTSGQVHLKSIGETFQGDVQVMVTDIQGRVVVQLQDSFSANKLVQFNMSNLSRGVYFVNILGENGKRAVKKLIVQ